MDNLNIKHYLAIQQGLSKLSQVLTEQPVNILFRLRMFQRGVDKFTQELVANRTFKIFVGGSIIVVTTYGVYKVTRKVDLRHMAFHNRLGNHIYSWLTSKFSSKICDDHRQQVKDIVMRMSHSQPRNHSHPNAARVRCKANMFMQHVAMSLGRQSYNFQLSPTQQRLKQAGFRTIYCGKDLQMNYQNGTLHRSDLITLTDVDYYVDMTSLLRGNPLIMYTFVPCEVAGTTEDGIYCTHADNTVETITNGGARYRHELWDYDDDHIVIDTWTGSYVYLIEQLKVTDTRRIVYFNPVRHVPLWLGWILPGRRLRRREFNKSGVMYSKFTKANDEGVVEMWHSMAYPGESPACTIRSDTFQAAFIRLSVNKTPHISDVERYFSTHNVPNTLHAATLFFKIFSDNREVFNETPNTITPCVIQSNTHSYQSIHGLSSEDGKDTMRAIWPGYGRDSAFSPVKSYNNDVACIKGRILDVKNKRYEIPPIYYTFLHEFVNLIVPATKRGTVTPLSYEEMWERFDKPTQRSKLREADFNMDGKVFVKSFQKVEAYGKITAPRNISTLPMAHNCTLGQFTVPLMDHIFKECHWYAFGKHPKHLAEILYTKAQGKTSATMTDFNKLDGSIQEFFRDGFDLVGVAAIHRDYHPEFLRTTRKEKYAKCSTAHGLKYNSDSTVLSGSSMTSILNTFINATVNYMALRTYYTPEEAWARLGSYGGDDGIGFDIPGDWIRRVAAKLGLLLETEETPIGMPVKFLGRIFPDIWTSSASTADLKRQLTKLHLTSAPKIVPDWMALYRKAVGYKVTDANTPLLTTWCDAVMRIVVTQYCPEPENHKYWHLTKQDTVYWSKFQHPFTAPTDEEHVRGILAEQLSLTVAEMMDYDRRISNAATLEDLYFTDIVRQPQKTNISVVVNGEVKLADTHKDVQAEILKAQKIKANLCRFARRGEECPYPGCTFVHTIAKVEQKPVPKQLPEVTKRSTGKKLPAKPQPYKPTTHGPPRTGQLGENRQGGNLPRRSPGNTKVPTAQKDPNIKFQPAPSPKIVKLPEKPKDDVSVTKPNDSADEGKKLLQIDGGTGPAQALSIPVNQWVVPPIPIAQRSNSQTSWTTVNSDPGKKAPAKKRGRVN
nr:MAG: hypothetical protein 1 [Heilongjiang sediment noda-like virus 2]